MKTLSTIAGALVAVSVSGAAWAGPLEDLKPGEWYEVPNSHLDAVAPPNPGNGNISCVMSCWAGGAFDVKRDRLYVTGGGHQGYAGNEIYAFDVNDLSWHRLNDPSPITSTSPEGTECPDPTIAPCSTHTYDGLEYMPPPVDRFIVAGCCIPSLYRFDLEKLSWEVRAGSGGGNSIGNFSAYDPVSGRFFYHDTYGGELRSYDGVNDVWKAYGTDAYYGYYYTAAIDPKRHKFVVVGSGDPNATELVGKVLVWDISDPNATSINVTTVTTSGDQTAVLSNTPGLDYDPVTDRIVAWVKGSDVYSLDTDSYAWEKHVATGGATPTAPNMNGTFGRFRYVPSKNVFILANNTNENVFFYKLGPGSGVAYDAGAGGSGGATAGGGASSGGSSANGQGGSAALDGGLAGAKSAGSGDDSGCGCRAAGSSRANAAIWIAAALIALIRRRRDR